MNDGKMRLKRVAISRRKSEKANFSFIVLLLFEITCTAVSNLALTEIILDRHLKVLGIVVYQPRRRFLLYHDFKRPFFHRVPSSESMMDRSPLVEKN